MKKKKKRGKSPKSPIKNKRWDKIKAGFGKILYTAFAGAVADLIKSAIENFPEIIQFFQQIIQQLLF